MITSSLSVRACSEALESRTLLAAGALDTSFDGDGKLALNLRSDLVVTAADVRGAIRRQDHYRRRTPRAPTASTASLRPASTSTARWTLLSAPGTRICHHPFQLAGASVRLMRRDSDGRKDRGGRPRKRRQ